MRQWMVAVLVAGCGGGSQKSPVDDDHAARELSRQLTEPCSTAGVAELSPALAPLAWWLGDWTSDQTDEHWIAAAGTIYGIAFDHAAGFEVLIVDDGEGPGKPDGKLRLIAMPGGQDSTQFDLRDLVDGKNRGFHPSVMFANDQHDQITYRSSVRTLSATVEGSGKSESFQWTCNPGDHRAEVLEAADRAFAADTAKRGVDGWVDAFAKAGAMHRRGKRIEGTEAIREAIGPLLGSGKLEWAPIASAVEGNLGFTVGKATFTGTDPKDHWRSTYVTIWQSRNDGPWKVLFDTGRIVNE